MNDDTRGGKKGALDAGCDTFLNDFKLPLQGQWGQPDIAGRVHKLVDTMHGLAGFCKLMNSLFATPKSRVSWNFKLMNPAHWGRVPLGVPLRGLRQADIGEAEYLATVAGSTKAWAPRGNAFMHSFVPYCCNPTRAS